MARKREHVNVSEKLKWVKWVYPFKWMFVNGHTNLNGYFKWVGSVSDGLGAVVFRIVSTNYPQYSTEAQLGSLIAYWLIALAFPYTATCFTSGALRFVDDPAAFSLRFCASTPHCCSAGQPA